MYKKVEQLETESENFELPFGGKLAEDNRWVIMAKLIPWAEVEEEYAKKFTPLLGAPAKFSLGRVMTKLSETSKTAIAITFLVMNLSTLLRQFFAFFCISLRINAVFMIFEFG